MKTTETEAWLKVLPWLKNDAFTSDVEDIKEGVITLEQLESLEDKGFRVKLYSRDGKMLGVPGKQEFQTPTGWLKRNLKTEVKTFPESIQDAVKRLDIDRRLGFIVEKVLPKNFDWLVDYGHPCKIIIYPITLECFSSVVDLLKNRRVDEIGAKILRLQEILNRSS